MDLSVVVNFYNMRREAERTLEALSRRYQRDAEGLEYEVLCIDNGSDPPLDAAWVEAFGPEFRLLRPSRTLRSPCFALNEAARQAKGRHLALMIDGAHLPTPGLFREVMGAVRETPEAVVALRQWWVGGEQRWLALNGYTREMEDALFNDIAWPSDGYRLFQIGAPMGETTFDWFGGMAETNCLVVPAALYAQVGGYDEAFDVGGGGFANLDLMRRVSDSTSEKIYALVGEATFHQFHGGATTNVSEADKDAQVRLYASDYAALRGERFQPVPADRLRVRGQTRSSRRRIPYPSGVGLTPDVRPVPANKTFPSVERRLMSAAFVEGGLHERTRWLGHKLPLSPFDLVAVQEIMTRTRPSRTVLVRPQPGLIAFVDSMHRLLGPRNAIMIVVGDLPEDLQVETKVEVVASKPSSPSAVRQARDLVGLTESSLVLFCPPHDEPLPTAELRAYAQLVSHRGYLVYLGSIFGQPWLGYSVNRHRLAIHSLLRQDSAFVIDSQFADSVVSVCPAGYLLKIGATCEDDVDDAALDDLREFEETA